MLFIEWSKSRYHQCWKNISKCVRFGNFVSKVCTSNFKSWCTSFGSVHIALKLLVFSWLLRDECTGPTRTLCWKCVSITRNYRAQFQSSGTHYSKVWYLFMYQGYGTDAVGSNILTVFLRSFLHNYLLMKKRVWLLVSEITKVTGIRSAHLNLNLTESYTGEWVEPNVNV